MAGKVDNASQAAAIARFAEILPSAPAVRKHLESVLSSPAFRGSRRSREFLSSVVENALEGQWDRLKERSLGIELFGRDADYDTGDDSIVRVTASDVRRRLLQYYQDPEPEAEFRIDLPAGSYIPEIQRCNVAQPVTVPEPSRGRLWWIAPAAAIMLLIGFSAGVLVSRTTPVVHPKDTLFYTDLLGPMVTDAGMQTLIVLSNPHLLLYEGSSKPEGPLWPTPFDVRVPPELARQLNRGANDTQASFPYHFLGLQTDDYTGMGEAIAAFHLGTLLQKMSRPAQLTQARFLNWDAARKEHLMILGAPHMSAWTEESLSKANFAMAHDSIRNAHPLAGELPVYSRALVDGATDDYGLIWMAQSPSGSRLLVLAGLTSSGTAGVGSFFSDSERMRPVYDRMKSALHGRAIPANWQVLVHIKVRENVPVGVSYVSMRVDGAD